MKYLKEVTTKSVLDDVLRAESTSTDDIKPSENSFVNYTLPTTQIYNALLNVTELSANDTELQLNISTPFLTEYPYFFGSRGGAVNINDEDDFPTDDVAWVLTATFIIFTMQSGFGLLESGSVSIKNETNIMIKNVVDVVLGGLTYWLVGYSLSFGESSIANGFCGWGSFALNPSEEEMGRIYTTFFFQLSFATTATTIVSGAVAERFNFSAYTIFSALNTIVYCIPAGWLWASRGFLFQFGVVDIAGSCGVHLNGGTSALVAAIMVGPRLGRYDEGEDSLPMGAPTTALLGTFMLWWGWLGFNCGSTFGMQNHKWKYAARIAVNTMLASFGGGIMGMTISWYKKIKKNKQLQVSDMINSILGALVSNTAGCGIFTSWEALIVGAIGGTLAIGFIPILDKLHIDDPVSAVSVHGVCGAWAMIAIGLVVKADGLLHITKGRYGLFRGGGFYLLGIQVLACVCIMAWAALSTFVLLLFIDKFIVRIRMSVWEELVGADFAEHGIRRANVGITRVTSALGLEYNGMDYSVIPVVKDNLSHQSILTKIQNLKRKGWTLAQSLRFIKKQQKTFIKKNHISSISGASVPPIQGDSVVITVSAEDEETQSASQERTQGE